MFALAVIGVLLVGLALFLCLRALALPSVEAAERVGQIQAYGFDAAPLESKAGRDRGSRLHDIGTWAMERLGVSEAELRHELVSAGLYRLSATRFMGYRVVAAIVAPVALGGFAWLVGASGAVLALFLVWGVALGFLGPITYVRRRARYRLEEIDYTLPELVDVLVVSVEAGIGFSGALKLASERQRGPLGEEMRLTLQEQSLGLSTNEALESLLERADTPAMRSFVRSIVQGETLGVSIGQIMRNLAVEMRKRRRSAAEERAHKAPVKMLFPLVFLIFPPIFIVVLYPAMYEFLNGLGG